MRSSRSWRRILASLALICCTATAQEGYPLDGTWRGNWGAEDETSHLVVIVMKWDGENVNVRINPGPNALPSASATLDPSSWTVHIEAQSREGGPVVIEGTLGDIGSYNRTIEGTWTQGGETHPFRIARE